MATANTNNSHNNNNNSNNNAMARALPLSRSLSLSLSRSGSGSASASASGLFSTSKHSDGGTYFATLGHRDGSSSLARLPPETNTETKTTHGHEHEKLKHQRSEMLHFLDDLDTLERRANSPFQGITNTTVGATSTGSCSGNISGIDIDVTIGLNETQNSGLLTAANHSHSNSHSVSGDHDLSAWATLIGNLATSSSFNELVAHRIRTASTSSDLDEHEMATVVVQAVASISDANQHYDIRRSTSKTALNDSIIASPPKTAERSCDITVASKARSFSAVSVNYGNTCGNARNAQSVKESRPKIRNPSKFETIERITCDLAVSERPMTPVSQPAADDDAALAAQSTSLQISKVANDPTIVESSPGGARLVKSLGLLQEITNDLLLCQSFYRWKTIARIHKRLLRVTS